MYHLLNSLKLISSFHRHFFNTEFSKGEDRLEKVELHASHEEKEKQALQVFSKHAACGVQRPPHCHRSPSNLSVLAHQHCSTCHSHCLGIKLNIYLWQRARRGCMTINSLKESFPMISSSLSGCCTYVRRRGPRAQHISRELDS